MPDRVEATVRDAATIDVECEACGHKFSYDQIFLLRAEVRQAAPREDAVKEVRKLGEQMRDGFGRNDYSRLSWKRCTNCGYTQSWMTKRARISQGLRLFLIPEILLFFGSFIAAIFIPNPEVGGEVLKYGLIGAAVLPIVAAISMMLAYRPNRGRNVARFNRPNITFDVEKAHVPEYINVGNMPGGPPKV